MSSAAEPALRVVRRFSERIRDERADEPLADALANKIDWDVLQESQGKRLFAESAEAALKTYNDSSGLANVFVEVSQLEEVSQKLDASWKRVLKILADKEKKSNRAPAVTAKPNVHTVMAMIQESRSKLERKQKTKSGKVKNWFRGIADTINDHDYLFELLPQGDKYTSVIIGTFTTLVKAAATYQKTADKISDSLDQLLDEVRHLYSAMAIKPDSSYIRSEVAKFYCVFFEFLVKLLDYWYTCSSKRFFTSLGNTLETSCEDALQKMKRHRQNVETYLSRITQAQLNKLGEFFHAGLVGTVYDMDKTNGPPSFASTGKLGPPPPPAGNATGLLHVAGMTEPGKANTVASIRGSINAEDPADHSEEDEVELEGEMSSEMHQNISWKPTWTKSSIREAVANLKKYSQKERTTRLVQQAEHLTVSRDVLPSIQAWVTSPKSGALWIEGPAGVSEPSQNTLTSAYTLMGIQRLNIPVMGYFCAYDYRKGGEFNRPVELMKLVYSLIYQIAELLPENARSGGNCEVAFTAERFFCLDGEPGSVNAAIELLRDLLSIGPPLFFCVVDGIQLLDREVNSEGLKDSMKMLIEVLCEAAADIAVHSRTVKVMLSTDGACMGLRIPVRSGILMNVSYSKERRHEPILLREVDVARLKGEDTGSTF